jgi:3-oxosteroid 1-dehydrogenase
MQASPWSSAVDWICIGSGAGGCAAAIAGQAQGFTVMLVESSPFIGGTTSQSGGILWVPMNYLQQEAGLEDSRQAALEYLRYTGAGENRPAYMETLVDHAARVLAALHTQAEIDFRLLDLAEFYYPIAPGSRSYGRLVTCTPFPAETLGVWRDKVRVSPFYHSLSHALHGPNPALGGSDGPQVGHSGPLRYNEAALEPWRQQPDWPVLAARLHEDEAHRVAGAALAGYLFRAVLRRGIEVRTECRVDDLVVDQGRVVGLTLTQHGTTERIHATRGVVLATGSGEGWRLAMPAGAEVSVGVVRQGMVQIHVPGEEHSDSRPVTRGNYELRMRHGLVVNRRGQRFGNEYFFQALGAQLHAFETWGEHRFVNIPCYLIFDRTLVDTYSFVGLPPGYTAGLAWVPQGNTLAELAQHLHLPAPALEATVARFNAHARRGEDPDFHRPPESLGLIEKPPFYGLELVSPPVSAGTIGLVTTPRAEALHHETRQPIRGLYACGQIVAASLDLGVGYQAGCQLMRALVHGFLAAEHAAGGPG